MLCIYKPDFSNNYIIHSSLHNTLTVIIEFRLIQKQADEKAAVLKAQLDKRRKQREQLKTPDVPKQSAAESQSKSLDCLKQSPEAAESEICVKSSSDDRPIRPSKKTCSYGTEGEAIIHTQQSPQLPKEDGRAEEDNVLSTEDSSVSKKKNSSTFVKEGQPVNVMYIANEPKTRPECDDVVSLLVYVCMVGNVVFK